MRPIDPREINAQGDLIVKRRSSDSDVPSDEEAKSYRKSKILNADSDPSWSPPESLAKKKRTSEKPAYKKGSKDSKKEIEPRGMSNVSESEQGGAKERFPKFRMVNIPRVEKTVQKEAESKPQRAAAKYPLFRMVVNQRVGKTKEKAVQESKVRVSDPESGPPEVPLPVFVKVNISERKSSDAVDMDDKLDSKPAKIIGSRLLKDMQSKPVQFFRPVELQPRKRRKTPSFRFVSLSQEKPEIKHGTLPKPRLATGKRIAQEVDLSTRGIVGAKSKDIVWPRFRLSTSNASTGNKKRLANMLPTFSMVNTSTTQKKQPKIDRVVSKGQRPRARATTTSNAVRKLLQLGAKTVKVNPFEENLEDESDIPEPRMVQIRDPESGELLKRFKCIIDGKLFRRLGNYKRHAWSSHPKNLLVYECPYCSSLHANPRMLKEHIQRIHENALNKYPCKYCDRKFQYVQNRHNHVKRNHQEEAMRQNAADEDGDE